jgi:hypothetical protein
MSILALSELSADCALGYPEACTDPTCAGYDHLPDRDDTPVWTDEDEMASWLDDDQRQERRGDV